MFWTRISARVASRGRDPQFPTAAWIPPVAAAAFARDDRLTRATQPSACFL